MLTAWRRSKAGSRLGQEGLGWQPPPLPEEVGLVFASPPQRGWVGICLPSQKGLGWQPPPLPLLPLPPHARRPSPGEASRIGGVACQLSFTACVGCHPSIHPSIHARQAGPRIKPRHPRAPEMTMARPGRRSGNTAMWLKLVPRTWCVCGTLPSGSTCTNGSSAYRFCVS